MKEDGIAIKSGILVKRSKLIPSNSIQNIELRSGILMRFLQLTKINFWTSSPAQIKIRNKKSEHTPDSSFVLFTKDAIWLQEFMLNKREQI